MQCSVFCEVYLLGLDAILLEKINLEIEDFRFSLHNLLSEQQTRVHQLLQLVEPNFSNVSSNL